VEFNDLPADTRDALWEKHKQSIHHVNDLPDEAYLAFVSPSLKE
jgi:hypothetical protein